MIDPNGDEPMFGHRRNVLSSDGQGVEERPFGI